MAVLHSIAAERDARQVRPCMSCACRGSAGDRSAGIMRCDDCGRHRNLSRFTCVRAVRWCIQYVDRLLCAECRIKRMDDR
jgi:hypothetical protein